jgi:hypothetical protein
MKGLIFSALAITGFIGIIAVQSAQAQLEEKLRFTTSFPFTVGQTHFVAGSYLISPADDNNDGILKIEGQRKMAFMTIIPDGARSNEPKDNELTFEKIGDTYMLARIWDASDQTASEPSQTAKLLEHREPKSKVAERITVPFIKVS